MKYLPVPPLLRTLAVALAILAMLLAVASLPSHHRAATAPHITAAARGAGGLSAGAAEVRFELPPGVPIAGFSRLFYGSEGPPGLVGARAVVLSSPGCTVALASAEILLVPEALDAAVRARISDLGLNGLVITATHTHAGPGGYFENVAFERIATGGYEPAIREAIVSAIAGAIRRAAGSLAPARVALARGSARDLVRSRSGGMSDAPLTVVRLERAGGGEPIAEITVFASHATLLGKANRAISGDWPGRFLAKGTHGLRLFVQGALGDLSPDGPSEAGLDAYAAALSARVDALTPGAPDPAPPLAFAEAEVGLPAPDLGAAPPLLRRAGRNVAFALDALPATARVEAVRIGPALLVAVPGEPVAAVAAGWRAALPPGAVIVSLAGGYVGYIETPERMAARAGETARTYYGPELAARLGAAARAAAEALEGGAAAAPSGRAAAGP